MLIEELIRLGRPLLESDMRPEEVLALIMDVTDERVKNFYRHVFVVELPADGQGEPWVLPMQEFGQENEEGDFEVNRAQGASAPIVLPSGGNPRNPQGRYGLPVYPCYDYHLRTFRESAQEVVDFLGGRLERTPGFTVSEEMVTKIASALHDAVAQTDFGDERKLLGVLILARCGADEFYSVAKDASREDRIGQTEAGRAIVPNYAHIVEAVWTAKIEEGREAGSRPGPCSFSEAEGEGEVVSAYCKAWPWAFPTWTCPLPHGGNETMLVEGIGVAPEMYRALTLGACVFNQLTRRVSSLVIPEIFSPADTRRAKEQRKLSDLPTIHGSAFLLPVQDCTLDNPDQRNEFVRGMRGRLAADPNDPTLADRYMTAVTGFETMLPEGTTDDYRLTLVYYSGDYTRGDIHLRAFIQDVIPSTLWTLRKLAQSQARTAMALLRLLMPGMSEKQQAYLARCYESVPYVLARAYGGAYLWQQLEAVLHRRPLDVRRVTTNAARRMQSLVPQWPDSRYEMAEEVCFFLSFQDFLHVVNGELARKKENDRMSMRPWKDLIRLIEREPVETLQLESPAELGFACGMLVSRYSYWYRVTLGSGKDYLKHRVMTFGSELPPQVIQAALRGMWDVAKRDEKLHSHLVFGQLAHYATSEERREHFGDFQRRLGVILAELERQDPQELSKNRDSFMTGFWSGYSLQGYDRPHLVKDETEELVTQS
jgi:hypothetical protein